MLFTQNFAFPKGHPRRTAKSVRTCKLCKEGILLALAVLFAADIIGVMPAQAKQNSKIQLNYKNVTMQTGSRMNLHIASAKGLKSSRKVTWKSSNKKVAAVNKSGAVTAKKTGTTTITAITKDKKRKASCEIKVQKKKSEKSNVLVVYFSCTGTTKGIAEKIASATEGDIYKITPAKAYTSKDLNYSNDSSRATKEQNNRKYRPQLKGRAANIKEYDYIFIGYPIWWGEAPRVLSTFMESYDFSGKTVIPFCTSGSSGIKTSVKVLKSQTQGKAKWRAGKRFDGGESLKTVKKWTDSLKIKKSNVTTFPLSKGKNGKAPVIRLNSGYDMPILGLGTYSLLDDECVNSVSAALKLGFRKIDTAYIYDNEESVGEGIRKSGVPREKVFVTTKLYMDQYKNASKAIDDALKRLDVEYIDLMLLHHPGKDDVKAYRAMEKAVRQGKIRSIGLSNYYIQELEEFLPKVSITPALIQNEIHPYYQEKEVVDYMHDKGIAIEAWYPFGDRGYTGKLFKDKTISAIAKKHGKSSAQVILRWHLQRGVVAIPGSSNPDHIKENISVFDFKLSKKEMEQIGKFDRDEKHDWY